MNKIADWKIYLTITLTGIIFFLPFLGGVHLFDWDEINFAECAREMIASGDYFHVTIDYIPFWEKPPLFIWTQVLSMKIFGVNEFAARFPNAVIGIITLCVIYSLGKKFFSQKFGILWALVYFGTLLPNFYFRFGIIDPAFNLFIFLGIYYISEFYRKNFFTENSEENFSSTKKSLKEILLGGIFIGLAIMTKGPVGFLLPAIAWGIFWIIQRKNIFFPWKEIFLCTLAAFFLPALWYGIDAAVNGPWLVQEFFRYQVRLLTTGDAGHGQPWFYHPLVLFIGCFPATAFFFSALRKNSFENSEQRNFSLWMKILFFVVLIVFSIVKTKIVHYSSLTYFPLTYLAAWTIFQISEKKISWKKHYTILLIVLGIIWSVAFFAVTFIGLKVQEIQPKIRDVFARENLNAAVPWSGFEMLIGIFLLLAVIAGIFLVRKNFLRGIALIFSSSAVAMFLVWSVIAPKIEGYTQRAPVEFYESLQGKNVYVYPLGFKSYAHLFYSRKPQHLAPDFSELPKENTEEFLLNGKLSRPAYFVAKIKGVERYREHPNLREIFTKNGFVFFERKK